MTTALILVFSTNVGIEDLRRLCRRGALWINYSRVNRKASEIFWREYAMPMALTIETRQVAIDAQLLDDWLNDGLLHFPDVETLEVLGFPTRSVAEDLTALRGFTPIEGGEPEAMRFRRNVAG